MNGINLTQCTADEVLFVSQMIRRKEEYFRAIQAIDQELGAFRVGVPLANGAATFVPGEERLAELKALYQPDRNGGIFATAKIETRGRKAGPKEPIILEALKRAGAGGATAIEMSHATGLKVSAVSQWCSDRLAKGDTRFKRISQGRYAWVGESPPPAVSQDPWVKPKKTYPELILEALKAAGSAGLKLKELRAKTGIKRQAVDSTVLLLRRKSKIKHLGLGHYAYAD